MRWDPPTEGVTRDLRYLVELSCSTESAFDDGLPCENAFRLDTPITSGTISGLRPGRKYLVRVMALRNGERSAPTCAVATTGSGGVCVCVVCTCVCVCVCVCMCVCVCLYVCTCLTSLTIWVLRTTLSMVYN